MFSVNGIPKSHRRKKQITSGRGRRKKNGLGGGVGEAHEGEMERKMERKEIPEKKRRATKQQSISGACRARQVDTETK